MIVGSGLLAREFSGYSDRSDVVVFASGVSNSNEVLESNFNRELILLNKTIVGNKEKQFVYFSSCDVVDVNTNTSPYFLHKLKMEQVVKSLCDSYCIFRLPQVIGYTENNNSLVNYFANKIMCGEKFEVWEGVSKNLIHVSDVFKIVDHILTYKLLVNSVCDVVNNNYYTVLEVVAVLEDVLKSKAYYNLLTKGAKSKYNHTLSKSVISKLNMNLDGGYLNVSIKQQLGL